MSEAFFVDAGNRFYLMLCDVISTADSYESLKNVRFTEVLIVENILV